ncbi:MAG: hypothetical protein WBE38_08840 [Terracidiphilus sp.]
MNLLEAADARSVEADAITEQIVFEVFYRDGKMLPHAWQVDKSKVNDFDTGIFGELLHIIGGTRHSASPFGHSLRMTIPCDRKRKAKEAVLSGRDQEWRKARDRLALLFIGERMMLHFAAAGDGCPVLLIGSSRRMKYFLYSVPKERRPMPPGRRACALLVRSVAVFHKKNKPAC